MLYHLALDKKVQDRLRAEIVQAGEDCGHDVLMSLPLLDAVCRETMRRHAFFPYRSRLYVVSMQFTLSFDTLTYDDVLGL